MASTDGKHCSLGSFAPGLSSAAASTVVASLVALATPSRSLVTAVVPLPDGKHCSLGSFAPGLSSAAASTVVASPVALATPS
eukprot:COSAG06_NODE_5087_length_3731_cov_98.491465_4_plen_82_part_00